MAWRAMRTLARFVATSRSEAEAPSSCASARSARICCCIFLSSFMGLPSFRWEWCSLALPALPGAPALPIGPAMLAACGITGL